MCPDVHRPAGFGGASAEPTEEERAAAAAMLRMIWGIHISRAVYVMAELGIADMLANGPMTAAELAQATQAHQSSLYRVLRLLASLGVLTEHENRSFRLTVLGERLRSDVPASMRSWAMLVESLGGVRAFEPIVETVKDGQARRRHRPRHERLRVSRPAPPALARISGCYVGANRGVRAERRDRLQLLGDAYRG
jgi:hypothetical protein